MEKEAFQSLVKNYTSLNREEALELISLQEQFPYSQVIHNLCTRAAQDHDLEAKEKLLHLSAIYTTERAVLKSILSATRTGRLSTATATPPRVAVPTAERKPEAIPEADKNQLTGQALINDLFLELEKLKVSKHKFEESVENFNKGNLSPDTDESKKKIKKITETAEPADSLIEEIKTTKKKVKPEGPKQKEQIEIIENFIKTQPTITKNKLITPPADSTDLAEKSLLYGDNIVSETLVEILIKQGKKDKAIEILKKLIWKFPQKKAYFAAQIDDLKK